MGLADAVGGVSAVGQDRGGGAVSLNGRDSAKADLGVCDQRRAAMPWLTAGQPSW